MTSYSTNFSGAPESPISEGGAWHHTPNVYANLITVGSPNRAVGSQTGTGGFNDSYAYLSAFAPNVSVQATVYKDVTIDTVNGEHEVELLLRMADSGTTARCYECNYSSIGGYAQIVRWNGALGDFSILADSGGFTAPVTGDVVKATIVGGTITSFIKRASGGDFVPLVQFTDNVWTDGQPGIGMWLNTAAHFADEQKFGFTDFSVTDIQAANTRSRYFSWSRG